MAAVGRGRDMTVITVSSSFRIMDVVVVVIGFGFLFGFNSSFHQCSIGFAMIGGRACSSQSFLDWTGW